tara:strand:+ start:1107 stop:1262 length:156 start_codon:yes stop_codon:yes gene_type:complete
MITNTALWKSIRAGFQDMKEHQEMTKRVMSIIKGEKDLEPKEIRRDRSQSN